MAVTHAAIYTLDGKPLVAKAVVELEETPGVSVWGGHFRLPIPSPPMEEFRPQCVLKFEDGRQGIVTLGRSDHNTANFLGKGKLQAPSAAPPAAASAVPPATPPSTKAKTSAA